MPLQDPITVAPDEDRVKEFETAARQLQTDQSVSLRSSLRHAPARPPEHTATALRLRAQMGLSVPVIERNFATIQQQAAEIDTDRLFRETPQLAGWLREPDHAALAQDDLPQLGFLEWLMTQPQKAVAQGRAQSAFGMLSAQRLYRPLTVHEQDRLDALRAEMTGPSAGDGSLLRGMIAGTARVAPGMIQAMVSGLPYGVAAGTTAAALGQLGPQVGLPEELVTVPLAFGAGLAAGAARFTFDLEAGMALDDMLTFRDEFGRGIDPGAARLAALATGALNAPLESFQVSALMRSIPGLRSLTAAGRRALVMQALRAPSVRLALTEAAKSYGVTLAQETSTEVAQRAVTLMADELARGSSGVQTRSHQTFFADLAQEGAGALQSFALMVAPGPLLQAGLGSAQAQKAKAGAAFFQALGDGVKESKTFTRLPPKVQELVATLTEDGPLATVSLPTASVTQYFQSKGLDPATVAAELTGDPQAWAHALQTGEDLDVPTARYATRIAATEHAAFFNNELRLHPGEMNAREALAAEEAARTTFEAEIQVLADEEAAATTTAEGTPAQRQQQSVEAVTTTVQALFEANGYDRAAAESQAQLYAGVYGTLGQTLKVAPLTLYQRYGLQVERPLLQRDAQKAGVGATELFQSVAPSTAAPFYSALVKSAEALPQAKGTPEQMLAMLTKTPGVKAEEVEWSGVTTWMGQQSGTVTKAALTDFLRANQLQVQEVEKGGALTVEQRGPRAWAVIASDGRINRVVNTQDEARAIAEHGTSPTKFNQYTVRGGENYRELLLTLPSVGSQAQTRLVSAEAAVVAQARAELFTENGAKDYALDVARGDLSEAQQQNQSDVMRPLAAELQAAYHARTTKDDAQVFRGGHFDEPNVIAHIRFNERTDVDGKRVLFIEEVQSDWHQKGRKEGYRQRTAQDTRKVPDAPFKTTWAELAMKRMVRYAAEHGFDLIGWTTGEQQAERYDLQQYVREVFAEPVGRDEFTLTVTDHQGQAIYDTARTGPIKGSKIVELIGKDIADKIQAQNINQAHTYKNLELKVGGEGMKGFYDQILPAFLKKFGKKFGATVGTTQIQIEAARGVRYSGPELSREDIRARIKASDNDTAAASLANRLERGYTLQRAMDEIADLWSRDESWAVAKVIGWREVGPVQQPKLVMVHALPIIPALRDAALGRGFALFQTETDGEKRASIRWGPDRQFTISLGRTSNLTSLIHESGHLFLEVFSDAADTVRAIAESARTPEQVRLLTDYDATLGFLGVTDRTGITAVQHEHWAKAFELFLREGKAPSAAMETAFGRFRAWLTWLYREIVGNPYFAGVRLNDEIRGVFDRLLAGDEAIQQAEAQADAPPIFVTQAQSGLNDQAWQAYQQTLADAHQQRVESLQRKLLKTWQKEQSAFWQTQSAKVRLDIIAELNQDPAQIALAALAKNQAPDGTPLSAEVQTLKLDLATLEQRYGKVKPNPPKGTPITVAERAELEKIVAEMDAQPFVARTWLEDKGSWHEQRLRAPKGRGGQAAPPFVPGSAGASVYWDIAELGPASTPSRAERQAAIEDYLKTGKGVWGERALDVARGRVPRGTESEPYVSPTAAYAKTLKRRGLTQTAGLDPDGAAERFGYDSGDALVQALLAAPSWKAAVETGTLARMRRDYADPLLAGGLADDAAATVANTGRSEVIAAELLALARKRRQVAPFVMAERHATAAARRAARTAISEGVLSIAQARGIAQRRVGMLTVKRLHPTIFAVAARKASREAFAAAQRDDVAAAIDAKSRELLSIETERAVRDARLAVDEAVETFKADLWKADATLAKTRNMDFVVVARNLAAAYLYPMESVRRRDARLALANIKAYDNDLYDAFEDQLDETMDGAQDYQALTYNQFIAVRDTILGLWASAKRSEEFLLDGQKQNRKDLAAQVAAHLAPVRRQPDQPWSALGTKLLGAGAALSIVEHWVNALDKNDPNGLMSRVIYHPIQEAATALRLRYEPLYQQLVTLVKAIEPTLKTQQIAAPELRSRVFDGVFTSTAQIVGLVLHTGNASNRQKLVLGYEWGTLGEDGLLDTSKLDAFLARMVAEGVLTRAHYDFAEGVGHLFKGLLPELQRAHRDMYGFYFREVDLAPVQTPFGDRDGWYMPARTDPLRVSVPDRQGLAALVDGEARFALPTTGRGATKTRMDAYNKPLALDLELVPAHLDWALRFIHLEPRVKDLGRLIRTPAVADAINAVNPEAINQLLLPWLSRVARQVISERGRNRFLDDMARALRRLSTLQQMTANVVNIVQQPLGVAFGFAKVSPRYLASGMTAYLKAPLQLGQIINEKDPFMRHHMTSQVAEVKQELQRLLVGRGRVQTAKEFTARHATVFQQMTQHVADRVIWWGAYQQALAGRLDEAAAVRSASSAVRLTQGSYSPESKSSASASTPFARLFTIYFDFFNNLANLYTSEYTGALRTYGVSVRVVPRFLYLTAFALELPLILSEVVARALSGRAVLPPDEDDPDSYVWPWLSLIAAANRNTFFAMLPGGAVGRATYGRVFTTQPWDDDIRVSPAISTLEESIHGIDNLYDQVATRLRDEEPPPLAVRDILTLIGMASGWPTGALGRPAQYLYDVEREHVPTPQNPIQASQGLISGRAPQPGAVGATP